MNTALAYDDLSGRLQQVFDLPENERASAAIKQDLFTRLLAQPVTERNLFLSDISKTQGLTFEQARDQFIAFEAKTQADRKAKPYKPLLSPKRQGNKPSEVPAHEPEPLPPLSVCLSDIEARPVNWLWPDFVPSGSATLLSGDPGCGKTWFALDVAARLSKGTKWIDGYPIEAEANTLYLSIEDDPASAIRPRFDSLGGNPSRLYVYNVGQDEHLDLGTETGLDRFESEIKRISDVKLVVVDPIADFSGDMNPNAGAEVRALLGPLISMASRLGFALLLVGHLNKSQSMSAIYRAAGATSGWLGICRAAFMVFRDADDKKLRHVAALKANYAHDDPPQIEFRLKQGQLEGRISVTAVDIDEQLAPRQGRRPRERDNALDWLNNLFEDRDEVPQKEIEAAAGEAGFAPATLKRAKKLAANIISRQIKIPDGGHQWVWQRIKISEAKQ